MTAVTSEVTDLTGIAASRIGTTLHGKYRIDRVLGVGGMGVVYAATHRNGKSFAIKLLHPEYSIRRDIRTRFLREGYVANAVNHSGVVAVLDDDVTEDGSAFLVMELLDGSTVETLGARPGSRMPLREALGIAYQLLDVLDMAHTKAIVHRDIKPANLFVLRDGQVKVLDFGLARLRDAASGLNTTRTGETMGTPAFMPPEQARGDVNNIDPRTDIWAAGATLFTAISGCLVHDGDNARQVMVRAATMPARSISSVVRDAPSSVVQLLAKALEFDKAARWTSAAAMREAVAQAHEDLFGAPLREHLKSLFDIDPGTTETAPTQLSPDPNSIPMLRDSAVVSASTSRIADNHSEPTTLAQAGPTRGREGVRSSRRALILVAGLVTMLFGVGSIAFLKRGTHSANAFTPPATAIFASLPASTSSLPSSSDRLPPPTRQSSPSLSEVSTPTPLNELPLVPSVSGISHGALHPLPRTLTPAASANPPLPTTPSPPLAAASSAPIVARSNNKTPPSETSSNSQDLKRHRRIDDLVDHQ